MILEELGWNLKRAAMFTSCADRGFVPANRVGWILRLASGTDAGGQQNAQPDKKKQQ